MDTEVVYEMQNENRLNKHISNCEVPDTNM